MWKSENNKFLVLDRNDRGNLRVSLNPETDEVIAACDPFFEDANFHATVTSVVRTKEKQIELIRQKAVDAAFCPPQISDMETADLTEIIHWDGKDIPLWQLVWSGLLSIGQMINPPEPAVAEFDYIHADGRTIKAGHEVGVSNHQLGKSFDVARADLHKIMSIIFEASKRDIGIRGVLLEPKNGAVHVDCT